MGEILCVFSSPVMRLLWIEKEQIKRRDKKNKNQVLKNN